MKTVTPKRAILIAVWAVSLILVGTYTNSQTPSQAPAQPMLITGSDVGFQLQRVERGQPGGVVQAVGSWVVKVNGMWIPVQSVESPSMKRIGE